MRLMALFAAAALAVFVFGGEAVARGGGGGGGGFSAPRITVAPRVTVVTRGAGGRVAVPRTTTTPRSATVTRQRLNTARAIKAGSPRYITVTHSVTRDRCEHLLSRAGPPAMSNHWLWMSRYNTCRGQ